MGLRVVGVGDVRGSKAILRQPRQKFQILTLSSTIILATIGETNPQIVPIALLMPIRDPA